MRAMRDVLETHARNVGVVDAFGFVGTSATAFLASISVSDVCTVAVALVTVFTLIPLGLWRWRAFLQASRVPVKAPDSNPPEPPAPPCT